MSRPDSEIGPRGRVATLLKRNGFSVLPCLLLFLVFVTTISLHLSQTCLIEYFSTFTSIW